MLPAAHRMRRSPDFDTAVRRGRRAGRRTLVVHLAVPFTVASTSGSDAGGADPVGAATIPARAPVEPARVGFVVSRAVGPSVVRSRVKRRLRAVTASRLELIPAGALVVVRATPASAGASSEELAADLDGALRRAVRQLSGRQGEPGLRAAAEGGAG